MLDELRYDVDACRLGPEPVQIGGPVPRTAAKVEYRAVSPVEVTSDEGRVDLVSVPVTVEQVDVLLRPRRVGVTDRPEFHAGT